MPRCTRIKLNGDQCRANAVTGWTVCTKHGAGTHKRPGGRPPKDGIYKKGFIPERIYERFVEIRKDPALLELGGEIALLYTRLGELMGDLDIAGNGAVWEKLSTRWKEFETARDAKKAELLPLILGEIGSIITAGNKDLAVWREAQSVIESIRKLKETEHKRIIAAEGMLEVSQAVVLASAYASALRRAVEENVHDPDLARRILDQATTEGRRLLSYGS